MFPSFLRVFLERSEPAIIRPLPLGVIWRKLFFCDVDLRSILGRRSRSLGGPGIFSISFFLPRSGMVVGL